MALLIDTPRWPWRGRMWAHLISDESLDELHHAARSLGLGWLLFGRDHYDVPDTVWPAACELAELVDSRVIVRSLRHSGLRVGGGKPQKQWKPVPGLPPELAGPDVEAWLARAETALASAGPVSIDVLARPGEYVVLHMIDRDSFDELPPLGDLAVPPRAAPPRAAVRVVESRGPTRYSVELVFET